MSEGTWGEYFDMRGLEQKLNNACEIIASLEVKVAELDRMIQEFSVTHLPPAGAFIPRNHRRFGA